IAQATNGSADGFVVGEHTAQPAMANKRLASALSLFLDGFLRSALGTNKEDFLLLGSHLLDQRQGFIEGRNGMFQVNDVNLVTGAEDVTVHLGVPVTGLVTKVDTGGQHVAHTDLWHSVFLYGLGLHIPHAPTRGLRLGHPGNMCRYMCDVK